MMRDQMIRPGSLSLDGKRISVKVQLPWYRALPLSSVADLALEIDGQPVVEGSLRLSYEGHNYRPEELVPLWDCWWYVADTATLSGELASEIDASTAHDVTVAMGIYIPYADMGDFILKVPEAYTTSMKIEQAA